jgi:hypothetical protein
MTSVGAASKNKTTNEKKRIVRFRESIESITFYWFIIALFIFDFNLTYVDFAGMIKHIVVQKTYQGVLLVCECGGKIEIIHIKADWLAEIIRLAAVSNNQIVILKKYDLQEAVWGLTGAVLSLISAAQLCAYGQEALMITSCERCGIRFCGCCHNPLVLDPVEYTCIFCGGQ